MARRRGGTTYFVTVDRGGERMLRCRSCEALVQPLAWWLHTCGESPLVPPLDSAGPTCENAPGGMEPPKKGSIT